MAKGITGCIVLNPMSPELAEKAMRFLIERHLSYDDLTADIEMHRKSSNGKAAQCAQIGSAS